MESAIAQTLVSPEVVIRSLADLKAHLYHRFYVGTKVGDKFLCVVVKIQGNDACVFDQQDPKRDRTMARKIVKLWYDPEGDYLEVIFEKRKGYFRETSDDHVMEKVDEKGNILGFSVLRVSSLKRKPLEVALA